MTISKLKGEITSLHKFSSTLGYLASCYPDLRDFCQEANRNLSNIRIGLILKISQIELSNLELPLGEHKK